MHSKERYNTEKLHIKLKCHALLLKAQCTKYSHYNVLLQFLRVVKGYKMQKQTIKSMRLYNGQRERNRERSFEQIRT